jgi:cell division protein FtsW (lipid II flippase)
MAVTLTTASQRDRARATRWVSASPIDPVLPATSLIALVLVSMTYAAAMRVPRGVGGSAQPVVNLNTVTEVKALDTALAAALPGEPDRQLAAGELLAFLMDGGDGQRRSIANIGSLARVRITAAAIDRAPAAAAYRERLADERARAKAAGREAASSLPLFAASQLTDIKPFLIVRESSAVRRSLLLWTLLYLAGFHAVLVAWRMRGIRGDVVLLAAAHLLTALGFAAMISRPDPLRDTLLFVRYAQGVIVGLLVAGGVSFLNVRTSRMRNLSYVPLLAAFVLSLLLLSPLGSGPAGSGAKVNLGPVQPIEAIRVLLALFLAGYFARNWELLRVVRAARIGNLSVPAWLNVPRAQYVVPVAIGVAAALALFFGQKDLGPALMLSVVFLVAYGIARGTVWLPLIGASVLAAGFYIGYRIEISSTLADRVRMWKAPWDNVARGGDQIAQALWSVSAGGLFGTGSGLGDIRYLPAGHTDLVLAAVAEEMGFAGLIVVTLLYTAVIARGLSTARKARTDYEFFLSLMLVLFLAVPVLLMASGTFGLLPLTGVVTPFLSFGGSAMVANFAALGLLAAMRSDSAQRSMQHVLAPSLRWLGGGLAVAAAVFLVVGARVQVLHADDIVVKPYLGLQADGMRRYQYNPRILDIARRIPRGTIADRNGLPMATDDRDRLRKAAPIYSRLGMAAAAECAEDRARCYPLGGRAFHLIGDAISRRNWSASNTSFVERDSEARLRGFDDHQTLVPIVEKNGTRTTALRREHSDLVPLLRNRFDDDHPAVKAAFSADRELRLTIDARLQARTAGVIADYARRSVSGHAAAVVLDTATGDLLASVSYPWPVDTGAHDRPGAAADPEDDGLLDRARYGLYPPGSTFKLITAAAALRKGRGINAPAFSCSRLGDGRVGARISGYSRPIRDDVLDNEPHGKLDLRRALVVSCNAYFAQLAVWLGPHALLDAAAPAEIGLARSNSVARIRDTLPQAGYGQGDVVASPLRMARIAAAIAGDGAIRDVRLELDGPAASRHEFLPPETARTLAA